MGYQSVKNKMEIQRKIKGEDVKEGDLVLITYKEKLRKGTRVGWIMFNNISINRIFGYDFMLVDEIRWDKLNHKGFTFGYHSENIESVENLRKNIKDIVGEENWELAWKSEGLKLNSEKSDKTCATKHVIPPKSKDSGILPNFT